MATALALGITANLNAADLRFSKKPVPGQYIVVLKENVAALSSESSSAPRVSELASKMARPKDILINFGVNLFGYSVIYFFICFPMSMLIVVNFNCM